MKKLLQIIPALILLSVIPQTLFAQNEKKESSYEQKIREFEEKEKIAKEAVFRSSLFFTLGYEMTFSSARASLQAPSPTHCYIPGIGYNFPIEETQLSIQPYLSLWSNYFIWDEETQHAYIAEVENRTATTISLLADVPVLYNFGNDTHSFSAGGGIGFLLRLGFLSNGVSENDYGSSGTAGKDVEKINSWFYNPENLIYPKLMFAYTYRMESGRLVGAQISLSPTLRMFKGDLDGTMLSISMRITLPQNELALEQEDEEQE